MDDTRATLHAQGASEGSRILVRGRPKISRAGVLKGGINRPDAKGSKNVSFISAAPLPSYPPVNQLTVSKFRPLNLNRCSFYSDSTHLPTLRLHYNTKISHKHIPNQ